MSKRDVTIYSPLSALLLRRGVRRAGGAERQMALLAGELAHRGHRVALIVYPVPDPIEEIEPTLDLVERSPHTGTTGLVSSLIESLHVARALSAADGKVIVVRTGTPVVGFVALYSLLRRRRFVFSSANDFDFLSRADMSSLQARLYAFGVRRADAVVVQSSAQLALARRAFPEIRKLVRIPSFADDPPDVFVPREPTAFVWAGRFIDYKRPLLYADLAEAVPEAKFVMIPHVPANLNDEQARILAELERRAAALPNLELGVGLPHADLVETLAGAVALVNTSSFEGMPNTYLEAWGRGVPVLTLLFDPDGSIEAKGLGIAASGSWERFVDGARELSGNQFDRVTCAERTRAHVRETHSIQNVGEQWRDLVDSLGAVRDVDDAVALSPGPTLERAPSVGARGNEVGRPWRARWLQSPVFCYHAVSEEWDDDLAVRPASFEAQIRAVIRAGYRPAPLDVVLRRPGRLFHVTFDDAYSNTRDALVLLASLRVPATVFVCSNLADEGLPLRAGELGTRAAASERLGETMNWDQLRELAGDGVGIGSHTCSHPHLTALTDEELTSELRDSKDRIEEMLGRPCPYLAYPFGDQDARVRAASRAAGYLAAFAQLGRVFGADPFAVNRVSVYRDDSTKRVFLKMSQSGRIAAALRPPRR